MIRLQGKEVQLLSESVLLEMTLTSIVSSQPHIKSVSDLPEEELDWDKIPALVYKLCISSHSQEHNYQILSR